VKNDADKGGTIFVIVNQTQPFLRKVFSLEEKCRSVQPAKAKKDV
jgi:hypothetical protein